MHDVSAPHSLPLGHVSRQYESPPICAHVPPLQSLSVTHWAHDDDPPSFAPLSPAPKPGDE
jgi:hypothetical protein